MSPIEACKILDIIPEASSEQIERRFLELRAKLEDKIAKAPTPGLKEKYRVTLSEVTTAFEALALTAESSALPVLRRAETPQTPYKGLVPASDSGSRCASRIPAPKPSARRSVGKEFVLVAVVAVGVLLGGGWWVLKTQAKARTESEAKVAAEQKAAADRKAAEEQRLAREAADKAEKDRHDRLMTQLRARMAELNVVYDAQLRGEQAAGRELTELKSQERDASKASSLDQRRLATKIQAQGQYVAWLATNLPAHPARTGKAKTEELISARAADDALAAMEEYAAALKQLQDDVAGRRPDLDAVADLSEWLFQANRDDMASMSRAGQAIYHGRGAARDTESAKAWWSKASTKGDLLADYYLRQLAAGGSVPEDEARALAQIQSAADLGDAQAMRVLAFAYTTGRSLKVDPTAGFEWLRKAAESGHVQSMVQVARAYRDGKEAGMDPTKALAWWRRAAEGDDAEAMYNLGMSYEEGIGVEVDLKVGTAWYLKAAEKGYAKAYFDFGYNATYGQGMARDDGTALVWLRKSAEAADDRAYTLLGAVYEDGRGVPKSSTTAMEWYRKGAAAGNTNAMLNMADMLAGGKGVTENLAQAFAWRRKAADAGSARAMTLVGVMYTKGQGVAQDLDLARSWHRRAAELGDVLGMYNLGYSYEWGAEPRSLTTAFEWYMRAANLGNADAMLDVGYAYNLGKGVSRDPEAGHHWKLKAAQAGNKYAMASVGSDFLNGWGTAKNLTLAEEWYRKAFRAGYTDALAHLKEMGTSP